MTDQTPNVAVQNLKMLNALLARGDGNGSVMISWFDKNEADAHLPYDQPGKECGVIALVYPDVINGEKALVLEYDTITDGKPGKSFTSIFDLQGMELEVYNFPPVKQIFKSPDTITTRKAEFAVWSSAAPDDNADQLSAARQRLLEVFKHEPRAESGRYLDQIARSVVTSTNRPPPPR